ncbi:hypothetical protein E2C01_058202 [Portunus trituberculatus]|uniref:Uncharacterized protein n=1 Tax=Portunus trituberculatus TaxID=210409 RepID=A0A5B7GUZ0_PORTR|nr:hypothetical protein [Portunus trituberculatus]
MGRGPATCHSDCTTDTRARRKNEGSGEEAVWGTRMVVGVTVTVATPQWLMVTDGEAGRDEGGSGGGLEGGDRLGVLVSSPDGRHRPRTRATRSQAALASRLVPGEGRASSLSQSSQVLNPSSVSWSWSSLSFTSPPSSPSSKHSLSPPGASGESGGQICSFSVTTQFLVTSHPPNPSRMPHPGPPPPPIGDSSLPFKDKGVLGAGGAAPHLPGGSYTEIWPRPASVGGEASAPGSATDRCQGSLAFQEESSALPADQP